VPDLPGELPAGGGDGGGAVKLGKAVLTLLLLLVPSKLCRLVDEA